MKALFCLFALLWTATTPFVSADSATWSTDPVSGDWNTAENWTPNTVPDNVSDIATFGASSVANLSSSTDLLVGGMVFNPGASAYTLTVNAPFYIGYRPGLGITNNSGVLQQFVAQGFNGTTHGAYYFEGRSTAGTLTHFATEPSAQANQSSGVVAFFTRSTAGAATLENLGAATSGASGGLTIFAGTARGGDSNVIGHGATGSGAYGGVISFSQSADAENAVLTANGGMVAGANGGVIEFQSSSEVSNATVIANGGTNGGGGGAISFDSHAPTTTDLERIELFGNGFLDISGVTHQGPLTIGSLEGDGIVHLGDTTLAVGTNGLDTTFSGVVMDKGALIKNGDGTLILSGANTYTGGTTVTGGTLQVTTTTGSGTGSGAVAVNVGVLGGKGIISGAVTVGTGSGAGAFLQPSVGLSQPVTLTMQSGVTFNTDSTFTYKLSTRKAKGDQVVANGITIRSGAQFNFTALANKRLAAGSVFTAISNTSATLISGTFANLADGTTLTAGPNILRVSYTGGDGNDLTLTVQ